MFLIKGIQRPRVVLHRSRTEAQHQNQATRPYPHPIKHHRPPQLSISTQPLAQLTRHPHPLRLITTKNTSTTTTTHQTHPFSQSPA